MREIVNTDLDIGNLLQDISEVSNKREFAHRKEKAIRHLREWKENFFSDNISLV